MIKNNIITIVLIIGLGIFAYLYFTKPITVVNTSEDEIALLKDSINQLEITYQLKINKKKDSLQLEINKKDSIINQKNINYWYLKKKHEKELADIMALPNDSIFKLFTRFTD